MYISLTKHERYKGWESIGHLDRTERQKADIFLSAPGMLGYKRLIA